MARFTVKGIDELESTYKNLAQLPSEIIWKMLDAQADVIVEAQQTSASAMLAGKFNKGAVRKAVKKGKIKRTKGVYTQYIKFNGTQHGTRIAEIAFINEFGKKGQPARPFIKTANERAQDAATAASDKVFDDFIESL